MEIFMSHASDDKELAELLKRLLESEFVGISCWVSSNPAAIPMGRAWFSEVIKQITEADIMVVLLTPQSVNRMWVGFEAGMFWEKVTSGSNLEQKISPPKIFVLTAGLSSIPSPLDQLQSGVLSVSSNLEVFMDEFSKQVGISRTHKTSTIVFAQKVQKLTDFHYRSILKTYPTRDAWKEVFDGNITRWYCKFDNRIIIEINWNDSDVLEKIWVKRVLSKTGKTQRVIVKLNGVKVSTELFMLLDGGRIFVPYPEERVVNEVDLRTFWQITSDVFLLHQIIGDLYTYESIENLARILGFEIEK